jgi:hypothetical protein
MRPLNDAPVTDAVILIGSSPIPSPSPPVNKLDQIQRKTEKESQFTSLLTGEKGEGEWWARCRIYDRKNLWSSKTHSKLPGP